MFLPHPLLSQVCSHLTATDLKIVAVSNSVFCAAAQQILFQEVTVRNSTLHVAEAFAGSPHLAKWVHTFNVAIEPFAHHSPSVYQTLAKAISCMSDLVSLSVSIPGSQASSVLPRHSQFPKLRFLKATFAIDSSVVDFLNTTPQLTTLHLYNLDQTPDFGASQTFTHSVPQLSSCRGSLTSGWPASSSLFLTSCDLTAKDVRDFCRAPRVHGVSVLEVEAEISSPLIPTLQLICAELPNLERLQVSTTYEPWSGITSTFQDLGSIQEVLRGSTTLKSANICRTLWRRCPESNVMVSNIPPLSSWSPAPDIDSLDGSGCNFGMGCTDYYLYSDM